MVYFINHLNIAGFEWFLPKVGSWGVRYNNPWEKAKAGQKEDGFRWLIAEFGF